MHYHMLKTYSLFGLINSVGLVLGCAYLLWAMQSEYHRAYETSDGPLQRLLLGFDHETNSHGRDGRRASERVKTRTPPQRQRNSFHRGNSFVHSLNYADGDSNMSQNSSTSSHSGVVLPAYYTFCLASCFTFVLQAIVWILPSDSKAFTIGIYLVFTFCMCNDFLLLIHLNRPVAASAKDSAYMTIVPAVLVLGYVRFVLPGNVAPSDCHFCCVHFPKPGIEVPWLITGIIFLWAGICAEFRLSLICCDRPKKLHDSPPSSQRSFATQRANNNNDSSRCIPRRSVAAWSALVSLPYLLSSASIFVLHYGWGGSRNQDLAYCGLVISDLIYSLGYAPIFLYTVTRDSDDCRGIRMRRALQKALGGTPSSDDVLGQKETEQYVVDIVTDPRLKLIDPKDMRDHQKVGSGGFGDVYRASYHGLPIAVKKLKGIDTKCRTTLRELSNEAGMLAELRHPNIVLFLGVVVTRDYCALVTEFMDGGSVRDMLDDLVEIPFKNNQPTRMTHPHRFLVLRDTARGMIHLHAGLGGVGGIGGVGGRGDDGGGGGGRVSDLRGGTGPVIHRDMKTQNLLVDSREHPRTVKVCDFGLSTTKERFLKRTLTAVGTPQYAAPEVLRDEAYSEKADVYSFGVVIWELFQPNGKFPFDNMQALRAAHEVAYSGLRPSPDVPRDTTPAWVQKMIAKCWVSDPKDRPSFAEMLDTIERHYQPEDR